MPKRKPSAHRNRHRDGRTRADGPIWLYGLHTVASALANPARRCTRILLTEEAAVSLEQDLAQAAEFGRPPPELVTRGQLDLALPEGAVHQGAAVLADPLPPADLEQVLGDAGAGTVAVVLDQPSDPRNVGAILRSASAFAAACVILPDRHAPDTTAVLAKAASGALDQVPLIRVGNLAQALERLKKMDFWCIGLSAEGDANIADTRRFDKTALVIGAEGHGLRRLTAEKCDLLARIPIAPQIGSLNMSAAAAIALYEVRRESGRGA